MLTRNQWRALAALAFGLAPFGSMAADYISAMDSYVDPDKDRHVNYGAGGRLAAGFQLNDWLAVETGTYGAGLHGLDHGSHLLVGLDVAIKAELAHYGPASLFISAAGGGEYAKPEAAARFSPMASPGLGIDLRLYSNVRLRAEADEQFVFGSPGNSSRVDHDFWAGVGFVVDLPHQRPAAHVTEIAAAVVPVDDVFTAGKAPPEFATADNGLLVPQERTLREVYFAFDSAELSADAKQEIAELAKAILAQQQLVIEIRGNTDSVGDRFYNLRLSERRAQAVQQELVADGVAAERIAIHADGEYFPAASNKSAAGRAANRRIVVLVYPGIPVLKMSESLSPDGK